METLKLCSEAIDMTSLYKAIPNRKDKNGRILSAHINVYEDLPCGMNVIHGKSIYGYDCIMLKKDAPSKMLGRVLAEVGKLGKKNLPLIGMHTQRADMPDRAGSDNSFDSIGDVDSTDILILEDLLIFISSMLNVNCPQFVFSTKLNSAGTYKPDDDNNIQYLMLDPRYNTYYFAIHEVRHAWQKKYHPEMFDNYVGLQECREKYGMHNVVYRSQIAEFDADVVARATMRLISPDFETYLAENNLPDFEKPLHIAYKKAADQYLLGRGGKVDFNRVIDYKSIYPGLIL